MSHDTNEGFSIADEVFVMENGKIILKGTPEEVLASKDERVKRLIKG